MQRWFSMICAAALLAGLLGISAPARAAAPAQSTPAKCATEYVVKAGDWVRQIARQFKVDWQAIVSANALTTPDLIYPGQKLCIPAAATSTPTPTPTRTATGPTPTRTSTAAPSATPVPAVTPTFRIVKVVKDQSVTIETANFPAGVKFDVRFGAMGTHGVGGAVAATQDSGKGGTFQATFTIPAAFKGADQIALRLDNAATGYFAFNWFYNSNAP
ncbi:MAG: LysM peptidoglycan-binding domain-containing protein [Anaerolineales bacterium]|nr:LysM peptidoglycan-binding domain-containing protein [Anaerolineales bacterium]